MAEQLVLRKRNRDLNRVCTSYSVTTTTKFTLETCDPVVAYIRDSRGNVIAVLTEQSPSTVVTSNGTYNICLEGEGVGTLWAQPWSNSGEVEDCCDELRAKDVDLQNQIDDLRNQITNLRAQVTNLINQIAEDCCDELRERISALETRVTALEQGGGGGSTDCCDRLQAEIDAIKEKINNFVIAGGTGISVTKTGDTYIITNTAPGSGSSECCEELSQRIDNIAIEGGTGISVSREGDTFTVTNTAPGGGGGGSTECCEEITNRINNMTFTGGTGISVTNQGDNYTFTNTAPGESVNVTGGTGISVTKSGDTFTVINTAPGSEVSGGGTGDTFITIVNETDSGTTTTENINLKAGANVTIGKNTSTETDTSGNVTKTTEYTISAVDGGSGSGSPATTLVQGTNVEILQGTNPQGGLQYTINVPDPSDINDYMVFSSSPNLIVRAIGDQNPNIFLYDVSIAGATADNNELIEFETGKDKIHIRGTSLPEGVLPGFVSSGVGIYHSGNVLSYNDGTNTKTIVKIADGKTVVPSDVEIV